MTWRLTEDAFGLFEGCCIDEETYKLIGYLDKPIFEPIQDFELVDMIEYKDETYCLEHGVEKILFYTPSEQDRFVQKNYDINIY